MYDKTEETGVRQLKEDESFDNAKIKTPVMTMDKKDKLTEIMHDINNHDATTKRNIDETMTDVRNMTESEKSNMTETMTESEINNISETMTKTHIIADHNSHQTPCNKDEDEDEDANITHEDDDDGLPIDRGWAWVIAVAAFLNIFIVAGYNKSMGLLFIEFLKLFQASATATALIIGVMAGIFGVSVFITMQVLVLRFPVRYIIMSGGTITALGIILSVFATSLVELILTQSIFVGIGNSMVHAPGLILIGKYFKRRRTMAAAIAASGVSAGAVIFPLLVKYLLDEYGLRGTLLIVGGIHFHIVATGLLMVPFESFRRKACKAEENITLINSQNGLNNGKQILNWDIKNTSSTILNEKNHESKINTTNNMFDSSQLSTKVASSHLSPLLKIRSRTYSNASRISEFHSQSDVSICVSVPVVSADIQEMEDFQESEGNAFIRFIKSLGFSLWKNPLFLLLNSSFALNSFLILFLNYYPAYITDLGTSEQDAANFLSIAGAIDFVSRLGIGWFADLGYMKRTHICAIAQIISALNCHLVIFYTSYKLQIIGVVIFGVFGGTFNSFIPVLIMDFMGVEKLAQSLGFVMITHGLFICTYHPIFGALKDFTGTYVASYNCMGSAVILAAILLVLEPLFKRCVQHRDTTKASNIDIE